MMISTHTINRAIRTVATAVAVAGASCPWLSASAAEGRLPGFTDTEVRRILAHGPWPARPGRDPSNRVSGNAAAVTFGELMFFEQRLSGSGRFSCASCHDPDRNWSDNHTQAEAVARLDRNTPTLTNVGLNRWFGWDGASDSLWSQSLRPILDARELGASPRHVAELVRRDGELACRYERAFGRVPARTDDEAVLVDVGKALAAFQETLEGGRTAFDAFRDALARGQKITPWVYSDAALRGLKVFVGKGECTTCHAGPNFTNGEFYNSGLTAPARVGPVDTGREAGIRRLRASPYNLLGPWNDDASRASAEGTRRVVFTPRNSGEFKVPSLRNLMLTAPYMHDGRFATLADVVRYYSESPDRVRRDGGGRMQPLRLTAREQTDLVVFLESLSTFANPWRPEDGETCR